MTLVSRFGEISFRIAMLVPEVENLELSDEVEIVHLAKKKPSFL
jgi:hypothetical protein